MRRRSGRGQPAETCRNDIHRARTWKPLEKRMRRDAQPNLFQRQAILRMVVVSILVKSFDTDLQADASVAAKGFIELTKDGFRVTSPVTLEEGFDVEGDMIVTGSWMYACVRVGVCVTLRVLCV